MGLRPPGMPAWRLTTHTGRGTCPRTGFVFEAGTLHAPSAPRPAAPVPAVGPRTRCPTYAVLSWRRRDVGRGSLFSPGDHTFLSHAARKAEPCLGRTGADFPSKGLAGASHPAEPEHGRQGRPCGRGTPKPRAIRGHAGLERLWRESRELRVSLPPHASLRPSTPGVPSRGTEEAPGAGPPRPPGTPAQRAQDPLRTGWGRPWPRPPPCSPGLLRAAPRLRSGRPGPSPAPRVAVSWGTACRRVGGSFGRIRAPEKSPPSPKRRLGRAAGTEIRPPRNAEPQQWACAPTRPGRGVRAGVMLWVRFKGKPLRALIYTGSGSDWGNQAWDLCAHLPPVI